MEAVVLAGILIVWAASLIIFWIMLRISYENQKRELEKDLERHQDGLIEMINMINEKEKEWFDD